MSFIAFRSEYCHPLPVGHRFPMSKYELLSEQLVHEGVFRQEDFFEPELVERRHVLRAHSEDYLDRLERLEISRREQRRTGFNHSELLIRREKYIMEGSRLAAKAALNNGIGFNVAGGTHHAYRDRGEGFCLLNDIAIAALFLIEEGHIERALVVDLDVHQGNGTAAIFEADSRVFTFSMHGASNYPLKKEKSDLDIGLKDGTSDELYLNILSKTLPALIDNHKPNIIFFQSGVDILDEDALGRLSISKHGLSERDRIVYDRAHRYGIPVMASMGGGYAKSLSTIVNAHTNTYKIAKEIWM